MKITKIVKLKNDLYEMEINDNENIHKLRLTFEVINSNHLYKDKQLTDEEFLNLINFQDYSKVYTSALNYISYKMRSEYEVKKYLLEKTNNLTFIEEIISKLKKLNYINDVVYCEAYVKYQCEFNKKGVNKIKNELIEKRVNEEIINNSLKLITSEIVINNINYLIKYYETLNKNKSVNKLKETILRNLIQKGYYYEEVIACINNYEFNIDKDDLLLLEKELTKVFKKYQKKYEGYDLKNKVIKALLNKGFNYDEIVSAFAKINMEG